MGKSIVNPKAKEINLVSKSKREFFLLHGYTGSPTDFNYLGKYLNKRFKANVRIIRLRGHGEKIENLDNLTYQDFLIQAETELKKEIEKGKEVVVGGISVGSLIALHLSAKYPVKGILDISVPYSPTFIIRVLTFLEPLIIKKYWKKPETEEDKRRSKKAFAYEASLLGLRVVKQGRKELAKRLPKITAPCLLINVAQDKIFHKRGLKIIKERIGSSKIEVVIFDDKEKVNHNPFYFKNSYKIYRIIGDFVEKNVFNNI